MHNPSLFLLSIALSVQLASAAPVGFEQLAPVSGALKSAASALQGTTKGLSTGMAGGIGGMAGGMTALPTINKRQGNKSLDLSLAGVKPSDVMKVVQDPTTALQHLPLPVEGLTKRVLGALGGLGGLGGLLNGLPGMPQPKADTPIAPTAPPAPPPPAPEAKEKGTDSSVNIDTPTDTSSVNEADFEGLETTLENSANARNDPNSEVEPETARTTTSESETAPEPEPENSTEAQSFSTPNINSVSNSRDGEAGNDGGDTQLAANQRLVKRVLEALMPNSQFQAEGLKNPEQVLKQLGAADVIKTVIDAPDLTGMKAKRDPINPLAQLDSVSKTLNSAETLLKAVPLSAAT